jgi:hypothetical protein
MGREEEEEEEEKKKSDDTGKCSIFQRFLTTFKHCYRV